MLERAKVQQPLDLGRVPRLNNATEARTKLRCSPSKWRRIKNEIEHVVVGARRFWSDDAIVAYVRRNTHRAERKRKTR